MITPHEILTGCGAVAAGVTYFLGWWSRGPRAKSLDKAFDQGKEVGRDQTLSNAFMRVAGGQVLRLSPDGDPKWCDAGSQWDQEGAAGAVAFDGGAARTFPLAAQPGRPPCESCGLFPPVHGPTCEIYQSPLKDFGPTRTIYPELAALGAEAPQEPPEAASVNLDETTEQWAARMALKSAIWCAENGIDQDATAGVPL